MKIGTLEVNGNVFLAPMAGITDTAFRKVVQQFGVSAVWTEMMNVQKVLPPSVRIRYSQHLTNESYVRRSVAWSNNQKTADQGQSH